jgi:hypothetical protein
MASVVRIKRSSVQGKAPRVSDLEQGELALNTRDGKLFSSDGSSIFEVGANTQYASIGTLTLGNTNPYTLPSSDGYSGQILKTDGSGTLSWQNESNTILTEYVYISTQGQTTFSGSDNNNNTLEYDDVSVEVYLNGVKLIRDNDFFADSGNSIVLDDGAEAGDHLVIVARSNTEGIVSVDANLTTDTHTTTTTSAEVIAEFSSTSSRSAKYLVQIETLDISNKLFQVSEVLILHDGVDVYVSETNTINSDGRVAHLSAEISGGMVQLIVKPTTPTTLKTKFSRLALEI